MWFTLTSAEGQTTYARVMMSFITGNSVKLFDLAGDIISPGTNPSVAIINYWISFKQEA